MDVFILHEFNNELNLFLSFVIERYQSLFLFCLFCSVLFHLILLHRVLLFLEMLFI